MNTNTITSCLSYRPVAIQPFSLRGISKCIITLITAIALVVLPHSVACYTQDQINQARYNHIIATLTLAASLAALVLAVGGLAIAFAIVVIAHASNDFSNTLAALNQAEDDPCCDN